MAASYAAWMQEYFAYCDESGNTGHDLFAAGQPYFVLACPLFPVRVASLPTDVSAELRRGVYRSFCNSLLTTQGRPPSC